MKVRDADGMTFLMHAANPASSGSKKEKKRPKPATRFQESGGGGGGQAGPFVSRATTTGHLGMHTTTWTGRTRLVRFLGVWPCGSVVVAARFVQRR